jgi:hypothetical protein
VIEILFLDSYNEKDLVLEDYKFSIDALADTIIIQNEITLPTLIHNITSRYQPIRLIDIPII